VKSQQYLDGIVSSLDFENPDDATMRDHSEIFGTLLATHVIVQLLHDYIHPVEARLVY
jgi:hypothetical protein